MNNKKLTLKSVEAMRHDAKANMLCEKVTIMEKNENYIRSIVAPYQRRVLEVLDVRDAEELYLADDKVAQSCFEEFNIQREKAGLKVKDEGYCPLLVAEYETIKAKQEFVNYCAQYTGMDWDSLLCSGVKNCQKMVDIIQKLFAEAA